MSGGPFSIIIQHCQAQFPRANQVSDQYLHLGDEKHFAIRSQGLSLFPTLHCDIQPFDKRLAKMT